MTDRAAPGAQGSTVRNMEFGEMGGVPAPHLRPYDDPSRALERWDDIESPLPQDDSDKSNGPFAWTNWNGGDDYITLTPGEGYIEGWFATDERKQSPSLSPYEQEDVTLVVGWDPDAVYSSDIHDNREQADRVFIELLRNVDESKPYIKLFTGTVIDDGDGGYRLSSSNITDHRPIGRPVETISSEQKGRWDGSETKGPGVNLLRGNPTTFTGAVNTGPHETPVNAERAVHAFAPVDADAEPGTEAEYHDLDVAGMPAGRYRYKHRSNGGSYATRYDAALGKVAQINSRMLVEVNDFSASQWVVNGGGVGAITETHPRRLEITESDAGDDVSISHAGAIASQETLGDYRITFTNVGSSQAGNAVDNNLYVGITDAYDGSGPHGNGNGVYFYNNQNDTFFSKTVDGEATSGSSTDVRNVDFGEESPDITIERTNSVARLYLDGSYQSSVDFSVTSHPVPFIAIENDEGVETISIEEAVLEVIE